MAWGTTFTAKDIFISRQTFHNIQHLDERIEELKEQYDKYKYQLIGFATATPNDIVPKDDDMIDNPLSYIVGEVEDLISYMSSITKQLHYYFEL